MWKEIGVKSPLYSRYIITNDIIYKFNIININENIYPKLRHSFSKNGLLKNSICQRMLRVGIYYDTELPILRYGFVIFLIL